MGKYRLVYERFVELNTVWSNERENMWMRSPGATFLVIEKHKAIRRSRDNLSKHQVGLHICGARFRARM